MCWDRWVKDAQARAAAFNRERELESLQAAVLKNTRPIIGFDRNGNMRVNRDVLHETDGYKRQIKALGELSKLLNLRGMD